jgi:hypothetical protein
MAWGALLCVVSAAPASDLDNNINITRSPPSFGTVRVVLAAAFPTAGAKAVALQTARIISRQITQRCNATVLLPSSEHSGGKPASSLLSRPVEATAHHSLPTPPALIPIFALILQLDSTYKAEGYGIAATNSTAVTISGGDLRGLLYGAGKFLRTCQFGDGAIAPFTPGAWVGVGAPKVRKSFRALYLAIHFNNFYQSAPLSEVKVYIEDIALWGVNTVIGLLPGPGTMPGGDSGTVAPDEPQIALSINRTVRQFCSCSPAVSLCVLSHHS